jgi:sigma-E factor negative regulatory protein RseB
VLLIKPADSFRYGFQLWLDEATAMPLKSQMLDEQNGVVEQILFTTISMPEYIPPSALEPTTETEGFTWYRRRDGGEQRETLWQATDLPAGFRLTAASVDTIVGAGQPVHHLVYSDGLAAVSIFVEETQIEIEWPVGLSRVGSANAYTLHIEGGVVTAVGEVPARTVQAIARSLRRGETPVPIEHAGR